MEETDSLKSSIKSYFTSDQILQSSGSLKSANVAMLWVYTAQKYCSKLN